MNCVVRLSYLLELANKINITAELCRKLETENKKVVPWYGQSPESLEEERILQKDLEGNPEMLQRLIQIKLLDKF